MTQPGKFSRLEVIEQVSAYRDGKLDIADAPAIRCWHSLAEDWLLCGAYEYLDDGFSGFNERSIGDIILDLDINDKIDPPLSNVEYDQYLETEYNSVLALHRVLQDIRPMFELASHLQPEAILMYAKAVYERGAAKVDINNLIDVLNTVLCLIENEPEKKSSADV